MLNSTTSKPTMIFLDCWKNVLQTCKFLHVCLQNSTNLCVTHLNFLVRVYLEMLHPITKPFLQSHACKYHILNSNSNNCFKFIPWLMRWFTKNILLRCIGEGTLIFAKAKFRSTAMRFYCLSITAAVIHSRVVLYMCWLVM